MNPLITTEPMSFGQQAPLQFLTGATATSETNGCLLPPPGMDMSPSPQHLLFLKLEQYRQFNGILTLGQLRDHLDKIAPRSEENDAIPVVMYEASGENILPVELATTLPYFGYVETIEPIEMTLTEDFEPSDEKKVKVLILG